MSESNTIKARFQHAYKTESEWNSSNPILKLGETGYVGGSSDSANYGRHKVGDGITAWNDLAWADKGIWDKFNGMEIGGRNRALLTSVPYEKTSFTDAYNNNSLVYEIKSDIDNNNIVISFDYELNIIPSDSQKLSIYIQLHGNKWTPTNSLMTLASTNSEINESGKKVIIINNYTDGASNDIINFHIRFDYAKSGYFRLWNLKVEKGTVPTDWTPAPEDKADTSHTHSASDITSGTLSTDRLPTVPVSKGGTGLTSLSSGQVLIGNGTGNVLTRAIDTTSGGTSGSTSLITSGAVYSGLSGKSNTGHTHTISSITSLQDELDKKVPTTRTVNGKALSANITLSASDVSAMPISGGTITGNLKVNGNINGWYMHDDGFIYKYHDTITYDTTEEWYVKIIIDRSYKCNLDLFKISASYNNIMGTLYLYKDSYNEKWCAYLTNYNNTNILGISISGGNTVTIYLKLKAPSSTGSCSFFCNYPINSMEVVTDVTSVGFIGLRNGIISNTPITTTSGFYGSLTGNASSATKVYSTINNPISNTKYYIPFHSGSSSENKSLLNNNGLQYYTREGTESTVGVSDIGIGNSVASGTVGNKRGRIYLYGTSSGYTYLIPGNNTTSNINVTLPSSSGVLALVTDNVTSADKWKTARTITLSGSVTGSVSIDGSDNVTLTTTTNHNHDNRYVYDKASVSSGTMNDAAGYRNAIGMIQLSAPSSGTASYVNPNSQTGWHHFINMSYSEQSGSNMWQTQIANKAGTTDLWVRSRSGGAISNDTAWVAPWTRILTGSNYSNVLDSSYIKKSGDTMTVSSFYGLTIKRTDSYGAGISFSNASKVIGGAGFSSDGYLLLSSGSNTNGNILKANTTSAIFPGTVTATSFVGNASSSSQVYSTLTNPSSETAYVIPFYSGSASGNKSVLANNGLRYYTYEGTSSALGEACLSVGNETGSGNSGNKQGKIRIYGTSSGYTTIISGYNGVDTSNVTITLPSASGTLARTTDNVSSASKVYSTLTNPESGTTYYIPFHSGASSANKSLLNNNGLKYYTREGTTSAVGAGELGLGNNVASGTEGNKRGILYMYGTSSGYTEIYPGNNSTSNIQITLPSAAGTLARTIDNVASATKWQTARTLTIGNTGKSVDGSGSVLWSIAEIGAVNKSGDTMTGSLTFPETATIYQHQRDASNYTAIVNWYKGGVSQASYNPQIGQHNTGGTDSTGAIIILPYATETQPWNGTVGLYITKNTIKIDNNTILHTGNYTSTLDNRYLKKTGDTISGTLTLGAYSDQSTTFTGGIKVHDLRNATINPGAFGDQHVNFYFDTTSVDESAWKSIMHIKGWRGSYAAHEISFNATNSTANGSLYHRTGLDDTWQAWKKILDSNNYSSYALPLSGGTLTGNIKIGSSSKGYYLTDSTGTQYGAIYDNGNNLWIGAASSTLPHHSGSSGTTFISAGYNTTNSAGNSTIYVSVPSLNDTTWSHTSYGVLHTGNYSDYALKKTGGTLTGNLTVSISAGTDASVRATNTNGSVGILSSTNRGLYDYTGSRWIVYAASGASGAITLNGTATKANYLNLLHTNEINFTNGTPSEIWFNYRNGDSDASSGNTAITRYSFGNRNASTSGVSLAADTFQSSLTTSTYLAGNQGNAIINSTAAGSNFNMLAKMNSTNGVWMMGSYDTAFRLYYTANTTITAGTNGVTKNLKLLDESGNSSFPGAVTMSGTLTLTKTTNLSGTADNGPALIVGGTRTTAHMELDANEIAVKTDGTTPTTLTLNNDGGNVKIGGPLVLKTTSYGTSLPDTGVTGQIFFKVI